MVTVEVWERKWVSKSTRAARKVVVKKILKTHSEARFSDCLTSTCNRGSNSVRQYRLAPPSSQEHRCLEVNSRTVCRGISRGLSEKQRIAVDIIACDFDRFSD